MAGVVEETDGVGAFGFQCHSELTEARRISARVAFSTLTDFKADNLQGAADDTDIVDRVSEWADSWLVVAVANNEGKALLRVRRNSNQRQQQRPENCGSMSHSLPHAIQFASSTLLLQPWR